MSQVHELLIKVHDILDSGVSKCVGNLACSLVHVFNCASMLHGEAWASWFPLLHGLKYVVSLSEACLYGHINWFLAQAQQQSSIGLSQALPSKSGGKVRIQLGSISLYKRGLCQSLVVPL